MNEKYDDYLKDVIFLDRNPMRILEEKVANELKKNIMEKSFKSFTQKKDYFTIAYNEISKVLPTNDKIENNWRDCAEDCYTICHEYVKNEVESTAYMLRILSASVLGDTKNYKICFYINYDIIRFPNIISGKWNDDTKKPDEKSPDKNTIQDKDVFQIEICRISEDGKTILSENNENKPTNGRFILGAGPSASGKTYNAGLIIKMMKMVDPSFPEFFMTIDGGTYREQSVIYQTIIDAVIKKKQYPGLKNLMSASIFSMEKSIFESDSIKKNIKEYLLKQTKQYNFIVSLYVPDTLAFCGSLDCMNKIIPYIEITGDNNWIGLMIYQHKNGGNKCPFKSGYKCKGCTESGKEREKKEGKKYSSSAWEKSMTNGFISIKNAPNIRIVYHNNGGVKDSKSVFEDLSSEKIPYDTNQNIKYFFVENNIVYISGELKNREDCHTYLLTGCSDTYFQDQITRLNLFKEKKEDNIAQTVPTDLNNIKLEFDQTNENITPSDVSMIDKKFLEYYNNKYIGIPNEFMESENEEDPKIIQQLVDSGFLELADVDEDGMTDDEKTHHYFTVIINPPFDPKKKNDYVIIQKLITNDKIKLFDSYEEKEPDKNSTKLADTNMIGLDETPVVEAPPIDNEELKNIQTIVIPGDIDIGIMSPENKNTKISIFPSLTSILNKFTNALPSLNISFSKNKEKIEKDISDVENDIVNVEKQIVDEKLVTIVSIKTIDPNTSEKVNEIRDTGAVLDITEMYNKKISDDNLIYQNPLKQFTDHANIDIVPVIHGVIAKLLDYCKDKYIAIPKNLEDNDKKIINNLETNRYIKKIEEDKIDQNKLKGNEANYDYYEIILDDKMKEIIQQFYEDLQKLSVLNNVIVYERGDETTSSETTSDIVSQPKVKKSNIGNLLNVFKDVNNMSSSDFFNSLGSVSKHIITGSKTLKNKANGIPVNIGPKCKNPNMTKKNTNNIIERFGFGKIFGSNAMAAAGGGKKKRTRKNNPKSKRTKKNRKNYKGKEVK